MSVISTVILDDDGLLRTSIGCNGPWPSTILYDDWLNDIVAAKERMKQNHWHRGHVWV